MPRGFFGNPAVVVARRLVGARLRRHGMEVRVVETEAYAGDLASHFVTRPRTGAMLGSTHGLVYLFRSYGLHTCLNVTTDRSGPGGVLIRAVEPLEGIEAMRVRRGVRRDLDLTNGPAKLYVALGLDWSLHGTPWEEAFEVDLPRSPTAVRAGPRIGIGIGIGADRDLPWRFVDPASRWLSRPAGRWR